MVIATSQPLLNTTQNLAIERTAKTLSDDPDRRRAPARQPLRDHIRPIVELLHDRQDDVALMRRHWDIPAQHTRDCARGNPSFARDVVDGDCLVHGSHYTWVLKPMSIL